MMNERATFRAQRAQTDCFGNQGWVYGAYLEFEKINYCFKEEEPEDNTRYCIATMRQADWNMKNDIELVDVVPNTVRQCTTWHDKNGRMIYEGDTILVGDKKWRVVYDHGDSRFALKLYLPKENRVTYMEFNSTFVRQYESIEEQL